jgi:hypothetical protein
MVGLIAAMTVEVGPIFENYLTQDLEMCWECLVLVLEVVGLRLKVDSHHSVGYLLQA